jgi:SAM-dependent methyltransferase
MVDRGFSVVGADLSTVMLARARHRTARVVAADAGRLPFADASFSQAYAAWVLHLVGDPLAVLREVARVLAPGGRFADVPGAATLEPSPLGEAIDEMEEILRARAWSQARSADGVIALGEQAGFRLIEHALSEPITFRTLPSRAIANIESRAYSYLWDLDDQTWAGVVEPALAKLRALPDEPVDRVVREHTIVLERV